MGAEARDGIGCHSLKAKGRWGGEMGIDQKDQILILEIEDMFDLKLEISEEGEFQS
jgi:hypothetical protein